MTERREGTPEGAGGGEGGGVAHLPPHARARARTRENGRPATHATHDSAAGSDRGVRGRKRGQRGACSWCGLVGHYAAVCHVKARGERQPDAADQRAQELLPAGLTGRIGLGDMRRILAIALRENAALRDAAAAQEASDGSA